MRKYISIITSVVFVVLFASCGGDSGGGGGTPPPGPTPTPDPPTAATLLTPLTMKIAKQELTFLLLRQPLALLGRPDKTPIPMSLRCLNWVGALKPNLGFLGVQRQ